MGHPIDIFLTPPPDKNICAICRDILEDAVSMKECGHLFCDECANVLWILSDSCPNCRVPITGTTPCFYAREAIEAMQVKCLNGRGISEGEASKRQRGNDGEAVPPESCTWTGTCEEAKAHQNTCIFKVITCEWEGCNHQCMRKNMNSHLLGEGSILHMRLMKQSYEKKFEDMEKSVTARYERKIKDAAYQLMRAAYNRHKQDMRDMKESITASYEEKMADMKESITATYEEKITEMKEHYDGEIEEMREYFESIEEVHERVLPSFMNIEHMERRITKLEARKKKAPATPDNDFIGQEPLGDFLASQK
ncbi:hypothetical protein ACHAWO_005489 [Cyclotella atomus]|jgi:hypothetical protein|uniref:RING-type domain-containing protein n=1 Tax=Cyclotella atomus TaxID=382360 RepID=A0ABD3QAD5_9STRA